VVDKDDPDCWDAERECVTPESCFDVSAEQALKLAALLTRAAQEAALFQDT
jgi:hypothetical protein